ncbi:choice-of-anchor A family protein [Sandarakinorhabdus sp. DWP1-3-1]|uniref:choice-of-anchor A family protein n=1 Tax=Sandarakinorhabdus sp. DWP1-3-1 TaxID=2804627 RepID=UPI003CE7733F
MSFRQFATALVLVAAAVPAAAATRIDYSVFTLGDYTDAGGSNYGTGVAVAGNAVINSTAIGTRLTADRNGSDVVVVGGNIAYDNSTLRHGNVVYGGTNGSGQYTQAKTPGGSFAQGGTVDFGAIGNGLLDLSSSYGALAATGSFASLYGAGTLSGATTIGTDVFTLTTAELESVYALRLVGATGSLAIINVVGSNFGDHFSFDRGNYAVADVVFNFVDAATLGFGGIDLGASLLAPLATLTQNGGIIRGSAAVGNFHGAGANIAGDGGFAISDPVSDGAGSTVPEPASWFLMVAGFGMVGAAQRRRLRAIAA